MLLVLQKKIDESFSQNELLSTQIIAGKFTCRLMKCLCVCAVFSKICAKLTQKN